MENGNTGEISILFQIHLHASHPYVHLSAAHLNMSMKKKFYLLVEYGNSLVFIKYIY